MLLSMFKMEAETGLAGANAKILVECMDSWVMEEGSWSP